MTAAAVMFAGMLSAMKVARTELSALDVLFWRGVTATPLALVACWGVPLRLLRTGLVVARTGFGFGTMFLVAYSAKGLAIADMSLLFRLPPLLVAIIAPLALGRGERAGRAVWLLLLVSVVGVALILAPSLAVGSRYGLAAVAAGVCAAAAHVTVRAVVQFDDPRVVVFYFQLLSMLIAVVAIFVLFGRLPSMPSTALLAPVLGIGAMAAAGQVLMSFAYRADRAAVVAAASYSGVLFGVIIDIALFSIVPGVNVWLGGTLIVIAGIWLVFAPRESSPADRAE
jgi:drug/metabolite transporter (DMT)-like permease